MGVAGIAARRGEKVISLSILRHTDATGDERAAYLKHAGAWRRGLNGAEPKRARPDAEEAPGPAGMTRSSSASRLRGNVRAEQFVLTISERGYGKALIVVRISDHRSGRKRHRRHGSSASGRARSGERPAS